MAASADDSRADYSCPECESSAIFEDSGKIFECRRCGERVHEAVVENADALDRLARRGDSVGEIARQLLDTGGVRE